MFVFLPWVQNHYSYHDLFNHVKNITAIRNMTQSLLMITLLVVVAINDSPNEIQ